MTKYIEQDKLAFYISVETNLGTQIEYFEEDTYLDAVKVYKECKVEYPGFIINFGRLYFVKTRKTEIKYKK